MARPGRKRDPRLDDLILDATLAVLAEQGYYRMTIDAVAARAGAARATVYRRWPTKSELVLESVERLSRTDVGVEQLPDTGVLRDDLVAMILPLDEDQQQIRLRAIVGLIALGAEEEGLAQAATAVGIGQWVEAIGTLVRRALDRGEYPPADVDTIAEVMPMLCVSRAAQRRPITREWSLSLIDGVIIPALRGGAFADPSDHHPPKGARP